MARHRDKDEKRPHRRNVAHGVVIVVLLAGSILGIFELGLIPGFCLTDASFGITPYASATDADGDGIDDQADILESARAYVATRPSYGSAYYEGGWPDDGRGVCTDVVAYALRGAGYDLQELVNDDIVADPAAYGTDAPDKNIDYRRVRNLRVYLDRHATSLTTDISVIDQWQGGDIVVFSNHVGIVSDKRNLLGEAFVIHHAHPFQLSYEEDVLSFMGSDVVGHYRWSAPA